MASTVIVAVRKAVVAGVGDLVEFGQVPVAYSYDKTCMDQREFAYTRNATFDHRAAAMKAGRNFRAESGGFELVIWVESVGGSPEDAADRALALGVAFEEFVADNKQGLGGAYTLQVAGEGSLQEMALDSSSFAELAYSLKYNARLT